MSSVPRVRWNRNSSSSPSTSWVPPRLAKASLPGLEGLVQGDDLADVLARLRDVRDVAARAADRLGPGVVRGEGLHEVALVLVREDAQVARAALDVLPGVPRVGHEH